MRRRFTHLPGEAVALAGRAPSLLVNCAALFREDKIMTVSASVLDAHLAANLAAPAPPTRALADLGEGEASVVHTPRSQRVLNPVPDQLELDALRSRRCTRPCARWRAALRRAFGVNAVARVDPADAGLQRCPMGTAQPAMMPLLVRRPRSYRRSPSAVVFLAEARAITVHRLFCRLGRAPLNLCTRLRIPSAMSSAPLVDRLRPADDLICGFR